MLLEAPGLWTVTAGPGKLTRAPLSPWGLVGILPNIRQAARPLEAGRQEPACPSAGDDHITTLRSPSACLSSPWQPPSVTQNAHRHTSLSQGAGGDLPQRGSFPWTGKTGTALPSAEIRMAGAGDG